MSYFDVASVVLADSTLGRRVHYAVKVGRMHYDGREWGYKLSHGNLIEASPQVVVWLREWLTQGVIEVRPALRRYPDVLDRLPRLLQFTSQWGDPYYAHMYDLWNCHCAQMEAH